MKKLLKKVAKKVFEKRKKQKRIVEKIFKYPDQSETAFAKPYLKFMDVGEIYRIGTEAEIVLLEACRRTLKIYDIRAFETTGKLSEIYTTKMKSLRFLKRMLEIGSFYFEPYNKNNLIFKGNEKQIIGIKAK